MRVEELRIGEIPTLRDPVLVLAFAGWNDAGQAATGAARFLIDAWSATRFGDVDPEPFYNFTEQRPAIQLAGGTVRELVWPANELYYAQPRAPRDFVIWLGVEPHLRWRRFADLVMELITRCGVTLAVSLGGLQADVPHSRPLRVTGSSTDELLQERLRTTAVTGSRYQGPTGIVGVLGDRFRRHGLPSASLWANVPHYINAPANPQATEALLERLDTLFDLGLDLHELHELGERFNREVTEAVEADADAAAYVRQLEERLDAEEQAAERPSLPSGEALVRELEEFFRRRQEEERE